MYISSFLIDRLSLISKRFRLQRNLNFVAFKIDFIFLKHDLRFCIQVLVPSKVSSVTLICVFMFTASAHTGEHGVDEYPDISGITNARVSNLYYIQS